MVGPVLMSGRVAEAVLDALRVANARLAIVDRGAYLRATAPERCVLKRADVEAVLGRPFALPADLERIMPAFAGRLAMSADEVEWTAAAAEGP